MANGVSSHPGFNALAHSGGSNPGFNAIATKQLRLMGVEPPKIRATPAFAPLPKTSPSTPPTIAVPKGKSYGAK